MLSQLSEKLRQRLSVNELKKTQKAAVSFCGQLNLDGSINSLYGGRVNPLEHPQRYPGDQPVDCLRYEDSLDHCCRDCCVR